MQAHRDRMLRTREFADLAGVTPRALHHYDRLGLLTPKRTEAGYRAYSVGDIARLEQIVALKFLGIPLDKIRLLLTRTPDQLATALRAQRRLLEDKRQLIDRAITAIREAETALSEQQDPTADVYRRIIEVIEMQDNSTEWQTKYEALVDAKIARLNALPPEALANLRRQWTDLVEDVRPVIGEDPAGTRAQELAARWVDLLARLMGTPVNPAMLHAATTYQGTDRWAPSAADKPVWEFMERALAARR